MGTPKTRKTHSLNVFCAKVVGLDKIIYPRRAIGTTGRMPAARRNVFMPRAYKRNLNVNT